MPRKLSKSRYLKGINCPKALWLYAYKPELASDTSENQQFVFDMGHNETMKGLIKCKAELNWRK